MSEPIHIPTPPRLRHPTLSADAFSTRFTPPSPRGGGLGSWGLPSLGRVRASSSQGVNGEIGRQATFMPELEAERVKRQKVEESLAQREEELMRRQQELAKKEKDLDALRAEKHRITRALFEGQSKAARVISGLTSKVGANGPRPRRSSSATEGNGKGGSLNQSPPPPSTSSTSSDDTKDLASDLKALQAIMSSLAIEAGEFSPLPELMLSGESADAATSVETNGVSHESDDGGGRGAGEQGDGGSHGQVQEPALMGRCGRCEKFTSALQQLEEQVREMEQESEQAYDERFKLLREVARLRDDLASKAATEMQLQTAIAEYERDVGVMRTLLVKKEGEVAALQGALDAKDKALKELRRKWMSELRDTAGHRGGAEPREEPTLSPVGGSVAEVGSQTERDDATVEEVGCQTESDDAAESEGEESRAEEVELFQVQPPRKPEVAEMGSQCEREELSSLKHGRAQRKRRCGLCDVLRAVGVMLAVLVIAMVLAHAGSRGRKASAAPTSASEGHRGDGSSWPHVQQIVPSVLSVLGVNTDAYCEYRRSRLTELRPSGPGLRAGEYMSSCSKGDKRCRTPYFLYMQRDGNLVLYRGYSPANHGGPVWASNTILYNGRDEGSGDGLMAVIDEARVLRLVDGEGRVRWQRHLVRLPRQLFPWPLYVRRPFVEQTEDESDLKWEM